MKGSEKSSTVMVSYSTVVLYLGIIKVWGFQRVIYCITQNPTKILLLTVCQYWLGIADPKNVLRSILIHFKKLLQNLKKSNFLTD